MSKHFQQYLSRRMMSVDGWTYFCTQCGTYKPEKDFYKRKDSIWGIDSSCKHHGQKLDIEPDKDMAYLKLNPLTEKDFIDTQQFLKKIGYCFGCGKTIHQQFMEKYSKEIEES